MRLIWIDLRYTYPQKVTPSHPLSEINRPENQRSHQSGFCEQRPIRLPNVSTNHPNTSQHHITWHQKGARNTTSQHHIRHPRAECGTPEEMVSGCVFSHRTIQRVAVWVVKTSHFRPFARNSARNRGSPPRSSHRSRGTSDMRSQVSNGKSNGIYALQLRLCSTHPQVSCGTTAGFHFSQGGREKLWSSPPASDAVHLIT